MTDIKKIASTFNLTVTKFASLIGYTKQALYQSTQHKNGVASSRMYSSLKLLRYTSDNMYEQEIREVMIRKSNREKAIKELADSCGILWHENVTALRPDGGYQPFLESTGAVPPSTGSAVQN